MLDVSTGQLLHEGFAFTRMTATRSADAEGGNWFSISAELTKVRKVELRTAEVPDEQRVSEQDGAKGRAGQTNKPAGKNQAQATTAAPAADQRGASILMQGKDAGYTPQSLLNYLRPTP